MAPLTVGAVIRPAARGVGCGVKAFLKDLVEWQRPPDGGERQPSSASILRYAGSLRTRCNVRFAEILAEYLSSLPSTSVTDPGSISQSLERCKAVLQSEVERRYLLWVGSDPALHAAEAAYVGAYAVCRKETADKKYHQELIVLERHGEKEPRKPLATYVAPGVVCRGQWSLIGNTLCIVTSGYRGRDRTHDVVNLLLAPEKIADETIMGGILAGVTTAGKAPVLMPVVVVKLGSQLKPEIGSIGHGCDADALKVFNRVVGGGGNIMTEHLEVLDQIEKTILPSRIIGAGDLTAPLREKGVSSRMLVLSGFRQLSGPEP